MLHNILEKWFFHIQNGGEIIIPIFLLSIVMWTLIFIKIRFFMLVKQSEKNKEYAGWQREINIQFQRQRSKNIHLNKKALESIQAVQQTEAMRHIRTIMVLAALAPLLGLLGTVTGMISTFDVISISGTGNARALASGISEALITTQSGLIAAVPGMLFGAILYSRAEKLNKRIELFCIGLSRSGQQHATTKTRTSSGE
ncbi:MotA/TolQ/ExbB proton channel family protein [Maridesulfovibrio sp.]|uniref:MotA/TolQ/ExbB proton channel family protein n=1 Tax=unclassified Maridesulfovibrio TaxID=2794999 RepID=UPI003AFFD9BB